MGEQMARFEQKVDAADKSAKIFLRVLQTHKFHSGRGATKSRWPKAAILDFKDGHHLISISPNISAFKTHRLLKYMFSGSKNTTKYVRIPLNIYLYKKKHIKQLILSIFVHQLKC